MVGDITFITAGGTMKTGGGSQNSSTQLGGGVIKIRVPIMGGS